MDGCQAELIDKVAKITRIEIHVLVNIGQTQLLRSTACRRGTRWLCTSKNVAKSSKPMLEEFTRRRLLAFGALQIVQVEVPTTHWSRYSD
jgi:hypothetical protein